MSQSSSERPPRIVSATSRPPLRWRGWPVLSWLALLLAVGVALAYEAHALLWLAFGVSSEASSAQDVAAVQKASRALTLTVALPWLLASIVLRPRLRVVVSALICAAPAAWFWWSVSQAH